MSIEYTKYAIPELTKDHIGQDIRTFGWVESIRQSGGGAHTFIDLYFGFVIIKCFIPKGLMLTTHSSLEIFGKVKPNYTQDGFDFEVHVDECKVYQKAPIFPINDQTLPYNRLQNAHLALQTKERINFLRGRNELMRIIRNYYYDSKHIEITPPTLVQTQVEGGSTLFSLKFYGEDAYLTQSSQLYLETVVASCMKAYCIMPSYRAEKFNTSRHLSEYTHVEAEIGDCSFEDLLTEIEHLVRNAVVLFSEKLPDIDIVKSDIVEGKFRRISYKNAIEVLQANKVMKDKDLSTPYIYGDDISDRDEVKLIEILGNKPVFLVHFPVEHKPFYCKKSEEDITTGKPSSGITDSVDLLWPGVGEILGGSMRAEEYDDLMEGFKREGIDDSKYKWYTDLRLFGASKHGGYGLGFERFFGALMKYESVNKSCLYPRFPGRCYP